MKSAMIRVITLALLWGWAASVFAQQWSDAQLEVWDTVKSYDEAWTAGDHERFMGYFHDDYRGWHTSMSTPSNKDAVQRWVEVIMPSEKVLVSDITPLSIQIYGDTAVVHSVFASLVEQGDGERRFERGRWTDILQRHNGRWLLIGDHGGPSS